MMMIFIIGLVSQTLFFARTLIQWVLTEHARKVLSPTIYWVLSLLGAYLFFIYGWLRDDFSIMLGQLISYYIYIWNLNEKRAWEKLHRALKVILMITPIFAVLFVIDNSDLLIGRFLKNPSIPLWLVVFGSVGQVLFSMRFLYQFIYSVKRKESVLPLGFWIISLGGSGIIILYGLIRSDPVLVLGQSVGFIAYLRNIMIFRKYKHNLK